MNDIHRTNTRIQDIIRQYRLIRGYSQEYVAHHLGISQKAYSKIERGETRLTIERLGKICRVMEIPIAGILEEIHSPKG